MNCLDCPIVSYNNLDMSFSLIGPATYGGIPKLMIIHTHMQKGCIVKNVTRG
jgi:hypothetical protein